MFDRFPWCLKYKTIQYCSVSVSSTFECAEQRADKAVLVIKSDLKDIQDETIYREIFQSQSVRDIFISCGRKNSLARQSRPVPIKQRTINTNTYCVLPIESSIHSCSLVSEAIRISFVQRHNGIGRSLYIFLSQTFIKTQSGLHQQPLRSHSPHFNYRLTLLCYNYYFQRISSQDNIIVYILYKDKIFNALGIFFGLL